MAARSSQPPSPDALKAAARAELRALASSLNVARAGESVHGARRQIKRLRSLLRLIRGPLGEEAYAAANGALRRAGDALAGTRRAEALVLAAGRLPGGRVGRLAWLHLAEAHRAAHAARQSGEGSLALAREAIGCAARALRSTGAAPAASDGPAQSFIAHYRKARRLLRRGLESGDAAEIHEARKFVIHHLHHLTLLGALLNGAERRVAALETLREALGDLNDLDELRQLAGEGAHDTPEKAVRAMEKRRAALLAQAGKSAAVLFRRKPEAFRRRIGAMWDEG